MQASFFWSECRDSNSGPLEPHFYGTLGNPWQLAAIRPVSFRFIPEKFTVTAYTDIPQTSFQRKLVDKW